MDSFDDDDDELLAEMEMDPTPARNVPAEVLDSGEKTSRSNPRQSGIDLIQCY